MEWLDRIRDEELSVVMSELLVATADGSDPLLDDAVHEVLVVLRQKLGMDVVFVSEFVEDRRVFRFVDRSGPEAVIRPGQSNPVEESFCLRVVDGRLPGLIKDAARLPDGMDVPATPFRVGGHLSSPIVLGSGETYGTLCCFSFEPKPELRSRDLDTLRLCAKLVARKIDAARRDGSGNPPSAWQLEPIAAERPPVARRR